MNKKLIMALTVSLIVAINSLQLFAVDWSNPDWGYRTIITVDNNSDPNALTNYPVIVTTRQQQFRLQSG